MGTTSHPGLRPYGQRVLLAALLSASFFVLVAPTRHLNQLQPHCRRKGSHRNSVHVVYVARGEDHTQLAQAFVAAKGVRRAAGAACSARLCFHIMAGTGVLANITKYRRKYPQVLGHIQIHDITDATLAQKLSKLGRKVLFHPRLSGKGACVNKPTCTRALCTVASQPCALSCLLVYSRWYQAALAF